jgi:Fe-S cluster assembly protein SufB
MSNNPKNISVSGTWDFSDEVKYDNTLISGVNETVVRQISASNQEPEWMLEVRLKALDIYRMKSMPNW